MQLRAVWSGLLIHRVEGVAPLVSGAEVCIISAVHRVQIGEA